MEPLKHNLKICKHHVFPHWNWVVWFNLVTAPCNEPSWNIYLSEVMSKVAGKSACLLLWAPCRGSIWRIVCIHHALFTAALCEGEGLALRSNRFVLKENYTVPIEELTVMTEESVWALLRRQNLLPFSGTEPRSVCRRARGLTAISHYPFQLPKDCTTVYAKYICVLRSMKKTGFCFVFVLTLRRLMSYIYGAPILDVSRSHTTTQHSR